MINSLDKSFALCLTFGSRAVSKTQEVPAASDQAIQGSLVTFAKVTQGGRLTFRAEASSLVRLCRACPKVSVALVAVTYILAAATRNGKAEVVVSHTAQQQKCEI